MQFQEVNSIAKLGKNYKTGIRWGFVMRMTIAYNAANMHSRISCAYQKKCATHSIGSLFCMDLAVTGFIESNTVAISVVYKVPINPPNITRERFLATALAIATLYKSPI